MSGQFNMYYDPETHDEMTVEDAARSVADKVVTGRQLTLQSEIDSLVWGLEVEIAKYRRKKLEEAQKEKTRPGKGKTDDGQGLAMASNT
jgi:hypothetical protein